MSPKKLKLPLAAILTQKSDSLHFPGKGELTGKTDNKANIPQPSETHPRYDSVGKETTKASAQRAEAISGVGHLAGQSFAPVGSYL